MFRKLPTTSVGPLILPNFGELIAFKKDSALGPHGTPHGAFWCAGGLGSQFLFNTEKYLLEGGTVPEHVAESKTVFILRHLTSMTMEGSFYHRTSFAH